MIGTLGDLKHIDSIEQLLALHDEDFVRYAYLAVLGRQPDPEGFAGYLDQVRRGAEKKRIIYVLATSPEGRKNDAVRLPGLKEIVEDSRNGRSSFLSKALSGLFAGTLRPISERFKEAEYRLDRLNDLVNRRLVELDAATTQQNVSTNGTSHNAGDKPESKPPAANAHLSPDQTSRIHGRPIYALRSHLDRRRLNLEQAFGREIITDSFFHSVFSAMRQIADSRTVVGFLVEDHIVARWILTGPSPDSSFSILSTQLQAIYYSCFACSLVRRSTAEMDTCNSVAARALSAPICSTSFTDLPVTAFMLCAFEAHQARSFDVQNPAKRDRICAQFFTTLVPQYGLQRYVTSTQRRSLRQPATGIWEGKITLLQSWVLEADDGLRRQFAAFDGPALASFVTWFINVGLWDRGLDFCLSEEHLLECQLRVTRTTEGHELVIPPYFNAKGLLPEDLGFTDPESWLDAMVSRRRNDADLASRIFSSSVIAYASNGTAQNLCVPKQSPGFTGRLGTRQVQPGCLLLFSRVGNGIRHLIGRGWSWPEETHVWTAAHMAVLAINLDPSDDGNLDLFLEFHIGQQTKAQVTLNWNGQIVETVRPKSSDSMALTCSLGGHHKTGGASNILGLAVDQLFKPSDRGGNDDRTLGLALLRLSLLRR